MTSQTGQQTILIDIFLDISKKRDDQAVKFNQLM